jgi:hypothetical protein
MRNRKRIYNVYLLVLEMLITFLYRIRDSTYYGKYVGYMSDSYDEGLDIEMRNLIFPLIRNVYSMDDPSELVVGILFSQRKDVDYYSESEKVVFDLLYCKWSNQTPELFLHGRPHPDVKKLKPIAPSI